MTNVLNKDSFHAHTCQDCREVWGCTCNLPTPWGQCRTCRNVAALARIKAAQAQREAEEAN